MVAQVPLVWRVRRGIWRRGSVKKQLKSLWYGAIWHLALPFLMIALLTAPGCGRAAPPAVTVAAAASLKDVLAEVAGQFTAATGREVALTFGASGALAAQVRQGAAIDVFVSADAGHVDRLIGAEALVADTRTTVAGNDLVVVVPADSSARALPSLAGLGGAEFGRVAVGEPRAVPAGRYAAQAFGRLGLAERLRPKLVYAADVRQALAYVAAGEVDAAVVYGSDAAAAAGKVRVVALVDPALHDPIRYDAAVVAGAKQAEGARAFVAYLQTAAARGVFRKYGFAPAPAPNDPSEAAGPGAR